MTYKYNSDIYSLLHDVGANMMRGPYQGLAARPGQNKILKILSKHESMLQKELLKDLGIRASSLSELLKKLETEGLITREHSGITNENVVSITEQGRISALEREMVSQERDEVLFGCLTLDERKSLIETLNKLLFTWQQEDQGVDGEQRERQWREYEAIQSEHREILAILNSIDIQK